MVTNKTQNLILVLGVLFVCIGPLSASEEPKDEAYYTVNDGKTICVISERCANELDKETKERLLNVSSYCCHEIINKNAKICWDSITKDIEKYDGKGTAKWAKDLWEKCHDLVNKKVL